MTIMPEEMRAEVLKFLGPTGFTPPPPIVALMDQMLSQAVEADETVEENVERGILNFLMQMQTGDLAAAQVAIVAGCLAGEMVYRLADQIRRNTPPTERSKQ